MSRVDTEWHPVSLHDDEGTTAYLEIALRGGGREEVGILDAVPLEKLTGMMTSVVGTVGKALKAVGSDKASVEIGVEFAIEEGKLVALIARGSGTANLKVCLEWER